MSFPNYNPGKDINNKQVPAKPEVNSIFFLNSHLGPLPLCHRYSYGFSRNVFCFFFPLYFYTVTKAFGFPMKYITFWF